MATRDVLSLDTPDDPRVQVIAVSEPSQDLLDRARVGWEQFLGIAEEPAGE
ncbi:hypothetical protein ACFVHW_38665 [Streptomyces sp. NPDC127110]|uniref:hypothetical protein n=1 Tax=Streptomyces sp. NPDC127110 TaxID=3345362 RepID=UPI00362BE5D7